MFPETGGGLTWELYERAKEPLWELLFTGKPPMTSIVNCADNDGKKEALRPPFPTVLFWCYGTEPCRTIHTAIRPVSPSDLDHL